MKYVPLFITVIFSVLIRPQEDKIIGKYKMEYEEDYISNNGIITFDGTTFNRQPIKGKTAKGTIDYQTHKNFIYLNEDKSNLQVSFAKREIKNDTIYFRTINLNNKDVNNDPLIIYAGKLIKIK